MPPVLLRPAMNIAAAHEITDPAADLAYVPRLGCAEVLQTSTFAARAHIEDPHSHDADLPHLPYAPLSF